MGYTLGPWVPGTMDIFVFRQTLPLISWFRKHYSILNSDDYSIFQKKSREFRQAPTIFMYIYIYNEMQYKQQHNGSFCLPFNFMCWDYCGSFPRFRGYQKIYADTPRSQDPACRHLRCGLCLCLRGVPNGRGCC